MARTFANINADEEFNFWTQHNQIIVSTDALKPLNKRQGWPKERVDEYNKYRMQAVLEADFDLVIMDEAHKMGQQIFIGKATCRIEKREARNETAFR